MFVHPHLPNRNVTTRKLGNFLASCILLKMRNNCAQDLRKLGLSFVNAQDLRKIVLITPVCNICTRFAKDCTHFSNTQYMCTICARLYFFSQWAIYVQDCTSLLNALDPLTIYAQNIIIQQVIKFSIFFFKLTGQTTYN